MRFSVIPANVKLFQKHSLMFPTSDINLLE